MEIASLPSSTDLADPTSLRARALSTLKLKRKRPAPQTQKIPNSLPMRPLPSSDSFQLDYGQEDSSSSLQSAPVDEQQPTVTTSEPNVPMREEGEISEEEEEEEPPVKPTPVRRPTPTGPRKDREVETKPSLLDRLSDAAAPEYKPPTPSIQITPQSIRKPSASPPSKRLRISPDQVRPNLPFNQSDYEKAKDIILDLLGWGVAPEYLVDCGLTREMVFYAFAELKLRPPSNLDTTGLIPYNPETIREFTISHGQGSPVSLLQPQVPSLSFSSTAASSSAPATPQSQDDLSDMERQRRQELIARKAVLASRRPKPGRVQPSLATNLPPAVHEAIVDDFLKSITPTAETKAGVPEKIATSPSLQTSRLDEYSLESKPASPSPSTDDPPPTSSESAASKFLIPLRASPEPITPVDPPKLSGHALPFVPQYPPRRSAKRPVASDFVDVEGLGAQRAGSLAHPQHNAIRRKTGNGSFVNVRPTKCVIDLSDTESEDDEDEIPFSAAMSRVSINPSPAPSSAAAASQALLEKKEREIQRMKDLIAQHEQKSRLKKIGSTATSNAPSKMPSPSSSNDVPPRNPSLPATSSPVSGDQITMDASPEAIQPPIPLMNEAPMEQTAPSQEPEIVGSIKVEVNPVQTSDDAVQVEIPSTTKNTDSLEPNGNVPPEPVPEPRGFASYESLFSSYPSLRFNLPLPDSESTRVDSSDQRSSSSTNLATHRSSASAASEPLPACVLAGLKAATLTRSLDPSKQICQYEIPGGGACHDASCQDLHLSRIQSSEASLPEPSDDDVTRYLCSITSITTLDEVLSTVRDARLNPNAPLETRVARIMELLYPSSK